MDDELRVRRATAADELAMLRVERTAQAILAEHGVDLDALRVPDGVEEPTLWSMAFVAEMRTRVVGMARLSELEPGILLRLDQVSVDPEFAGQGVGRLLLAEVVATARRLGYVALTGTTFRDVAFNAPFYASLGCVEDDNPHPTILRQREVERSLGLDQFGPRIVMRLTL